MEQLADESLLTGFANGTEELTLAFVHRFQARVYGVALAMTGDATVAEDIAESAFERASHDADRYDPRRSSVGAWLAAITGKMAMDSVDVRKRTDLDAATLLAGAGRSNIDEGRAAQDDESAGGLRAALRELPAEQARALVYAAIGGLSAAQVAATEGVSVETARARIRTAVDRVRLVVRPPVIVRD